MAEPKKTILLWSLLVGLIVFGTTNYIFLTPEVLKSQTSNDYWRGTVDSKLQAGDERDKQMLTKLDDISREIKGICSDITSVKVEAAKNGALYGMASSVISYLIGLLIQTLSSRRRNGGGKP